MSIRVRATQRGYYGDQLREPGDEFDYVGYRAKWMEPVDGEWPAGSEKPEPSIDPSSRLGLRQAAGSIAEAAVAELAAQARRQTKVKPAPAPKPEAAPAPVTTDSAADPKAAAKAERNALIDQAKALGVKKPNFMNVDALKAAIAAAPKPEA